MTDAGVETAADSMRMLDASTQRTQQPLIKEYTLNYRGLNITI